MSSPLLLWALAVSEGTGSSAGWRRLVGYQTCWGGGGHGFILRTHCFHEHRSGSAERVCVPAETHFVWATCSCMRHVTKQACSALKWHVRLSLSSVLGWFWVPGACRIARGCLVVLQLACSHYHQTGGSGNMLSELLACCPAEQPSVDGAFEGAHALHIEVCA